MKKKFHKFKPLQELYGYVDCPSKPKVESEFANKFKENSSCGSHAKVKCCSSNTCAGPNPSYEHFPSVTSELGKQGVSLSEVCLEEVSINQASVDGISLNRSAKNYRQLKSGETSNLVCAGSCQSSYSVDVHGMEHLGASGATKDLKMLKTVNASDTVVEHQDQDVDCHGENSSCLSKDNGAVTASSDHIGGADQKNMASSAVSASSFCPEVVDPEVMEKSVNGQLTVSGSFRDQLSVEEGGKCPVTADKYLSEAVLATAYLSNRSDPSETYSFRDEQDGANLLKGVPFDCRNEQGVSSVVERTDSNVLGHNGKSHVAMEHETGSDEGNPSASGSVNSTDGNESLKFDTPVTSTQGPPLQSHNMTQSDGSDELVDVRVCDICGDVGREALLALCSKCSDGAEHIYCMRIKMYEVPKGDWVCEDCKVMPELKRQRQGVVGILANVSKPSFLEEFGHSLPTVKSGVQQSAEMRFNQMNKASCSFVKRPGPDIEMPSAPKKRTFEKNVQLPKSGIGAKTRVTRISSLKNIGKREDAAHQVSSFGDRSAKKVVEQACSSGHRSLKHEKHISVGSLCKSKSMNTSNSNRKLQELREDTLKKRSTDKERSGSKLEKDPPEKKLFKSLSFTGASLASLDVSNVRSSNAPKVKSLGYGSERNLTEKIYLPKSKTSELGVSSAGSRSMKVHSSGTKVASEIVKAVPVSRKIVQDEKANQANGNSTVKPPGSLAQMGQTNANTSVRTVGEEMSPSHLSSVISSFDKNGNAYPDQKTSQLTPKAELDSISRDDNRHLSFDLHPVESMPIRAPADWFPPGISAVPEAQCIWKGAFELEKGGKLPSYCCGVQAHLSTCVSSEVHELVSRFCPKLLLQEVPRLDTWPIQFTRNQPTEQNIALYFFAEDARSYERNYKKLVEGMVKYDLALKANLDGIQLLVFPSSLLPVRSQWWNSLPFLWGVYRARKLDDGSVHLPSLNVAPLKQRFCAPVTHGPQNVSVSPLEAGSFSSSHSLKGLESVDPMVRQSSASTKSRDQSCEHKVSSIKCLAAQEKLDIQAGTIQFADDPLKEAAFSARLLHHDDLQKGTGYTKQDMECISKTDVFSVSTSNRVNMVSPAVNNRESGLYFDGSYGGPSFPLAYDTAAEFYHTLDVASRTSVSVDSGPSGSSDGCAKSDEVQVEQSQNPASFRALNLDLCLGISSEPEEQVDLDLGLGFPSKYQLKDCTMNGSNRQGNLSLALSLGLPC